MLRMHQHPWRIQFLSVRGASLQAQLTMMFSSVCRVSTNLFSNRRWRKMRLSHSFKSWKTLSLSTRISANLNKEILTRQRLRAKVPAKDFSSSISCWSPLSLSLWEPLSANPPTSRSRLLTYEQLLEENWFEIWRRRAAQMTKSLPALSVWLKVNRK